MTDRSGRSRIALCAASSRRGSARRLDASDADALVEYRERAPHAVRAHPTDEHFLPLFVAYGAAGDHRASEPIVEGFEGGALSLHSWAFH